VFVHDCERHTPIQVGGGIGFDPRRSSAKAPFGGAAPSLSKEVRSAPEISTGCPESLNRLLGVERRCVICLLRSVLVSQIGSPSKPEQLA